MQIQDARDWGKDFTTTGTGSSAGGQALDIYQAYFQVNKLFGVPLEAKLGRQTLVYGDQRLLGHLGWADTGRAFDAYKFVYRLGKSHIDLFAAKIMDLNKPSSSTSDHDLYGLYTVWNVMGMLDVDVYYLNWQDSASRNVNTYGARFAYAQYGVDATLEVAKQGGQWGLDLTGNKVDQDALAFAFKAGYTMKPAWNTRIGIEYDNGSGDDGADATKHKTFVFPFHTNHAHYGYMDRFSWSNMNDISLAVKTQPMNKETTVKLAYHIFKLDKKEDRWYTAAGNGTTQVGSVPASPDSTEAGSEIDLTVAHPYNKHLKLVAGYSMFAPGDAAKERSGGKDDTATWGYTMFVLNM